MSQVYSTEPQTSGRVILETTHGPIEIQLWSRECPTATKMFMRLCLDGFYDNMAFHRIAPAFLIQTGALRLGSELQEAFGKEEEMNLYRQKLEADEALSRRSYELNSRIRFNHRGQVAMALEVDAQEDSTHLQPQFFITLDEAPFLDGKHVIFGTVNGPTIFNCLRIGKTDVDDSNQPTIISEAPRIQRVRIMDNDVHSDIVPSVVVPWKIKNKDAPKKKKKKRGVKNVNVLSFGDEFEVDTSQSLGIKSRHAISESKNKLKATETNEKKIPISVEGTQETKAKPQKRELKESIGSAREPKNEMESASEQIKGTKLGSGTGTFTGSSKNVSMSDTIELTPRSDAPTPRQADALTPKDSKSKENRMSLVAARRAKYARGGNKNKRKREEDTLSKLKLFQHKIAKVSGNEEGKGEDNEEGYHGQILETNTGDTDSGWMSTKFQCRKHMDIDAKLGGDGRNAEDYEVVEGLVGKNGRHEKKGRRHDRTGGGQRALDRHAQHR
ncbi:unnamed protein product [Cylindrotheca closterium]|uniref:PPIase cyclophilin-type domain-containing protein n=1 Tax=Cylindrotheca closterium TaxID=2856 RepID=A0AAD2FLV8_9STRA|nr:unnamed protein product [Cylindrotheca closterium]